MRRTAIGIILGFACLVTAQQMVVRIGKMPDGKVLLSSGQVIERETFAFRGRPADMAKHPRQDLAAVMVMSQVDNEIPSQVLLLSAAGVVEGSSVKLEHHPAFHGMAWNPDGTRLVCSVGESYQDQPTDGLEVMDFVDGKLSNRKFFPLAAKGEPTHTVPGGMQFSKDGTRLYVACVDLNAVLELDAKTFERRRKFNVGMLPYTVKLDPTESSLIVSNWGGRVPQAGEKVSKTGISKIVVDKNGAPVNGTVSIVNLSSGASIEIEVGVHPSDIAIGPDRAYVANTMSDSISEIRYSDWKLDRTSKLEWNRRLLMGSMPTSLMLEGDTLYVANGGDNAMVEFDTRDHKVRGYRPAGYFPIAACRMGNSLVVANSKGNGSLMNTSTGKPGNVHEFQGTVSVLDLGKDLKTETARVAENNRWGAADGTGDLAVYKGAIKHVLYIIKENKTYDQIFGDMKEGNGDPKLCILGEEIMPNHRAIAREFTLFDNAYVSGTNSGDGHQWSTQAFANDYVEKFYVGYSRTYNDDGNCAMSLSNHGTLWTAAAAKGLSVRDYGEFVVADDAEFKPRRPKDWFEAWEDRRTAAHKFTFVPHARVAGIEPYVHPTVHYWPLIQSDQSRADEFLKDLNQRIRNNTVPNLMIMSLPCDHSEGEDPDYPQPKSMMADNDLALGRVVDGVSRSAIWKDTCIFVIEDDSQSGLDHVDGHRTPYLVISPYTKRGNVDHAFYTTNSMIRSMELMLGFGPMNRFDAMANPITTCFNNAPNLDPFDVRPNNIPLDLKNPARKATAMTAEDKEYLALTRSMDWSRPDGPDPQVLDRMIWRNVRPDAPFPESLRKRASRRDDD